MDSNYFTEKIAPKNKPAEAEKPAAKPAEEEPFKTVPASEDTATTGEFDLPFFNANTEKKRRGDLQFGKNK